jgi:cyclopropane fatty-acyl-phospholipid synthase-like methyltransferase
MGNLDRRPVGARIDAYMTNPDVPSPIDLRLMSDACEWEKTAFEKRPWRADLFARFAHQLMLGQPPVRCVLELGSGPGFLASHLLSELPDLHMVLLDFSEAMHELARRRVGPMVNRVEFLSKNFKNSDWVRGLKEFDAVVTIQAVHELRHKRYAEELHRQVRTLLRPGGPYLVCDHFRGEDGMSNEQLYMTVAEQKAALESAGYASVQQVLLKGGLVLHRAN